MGAARPAGSTLSIPEEKACGGTLAPYHAVFTGPFLELGSRTESGLAVPTTRSGWVAVARRLPRGSSARQAVGAARLLPSRVPPSARPLPAARGSSLFCWGGAGGGDP